MEASGRLPAEEDIVASPRLTLREDVRMRRRPRYGSCSAGFLSWRSLVCVTVLPNLSLGQEDDIDEGTDDDGKSSARLADKYGWWLILATVGCLFLFVAVFCIRKTRAAGRVEGEEEADEDAKGVEDGKGPPVERIARTALVWDQKSSASAPIATASVSAGNASASVTSSSSHEDVSSSQSRSDDRRHAPGATRSASKLPRYSSDGAQSPVHGAVEAAGGRRSSGTRIQRGDDAGSGEGVRTGGTGGVTRRGEGVRAGSRQSEVRRTHQNASVGKNAQEIYIVHH